MAEEKTKAKKTAAKTKAEAPAKAEKKAPKAAKKAAPKATKSVNKNDFVIVNIKNSQEKVREGDELTVNKLDVKVGSKIKFDDVLLSYSGGTTKVGTPNVEGALVEAEVLEQTKGEKVHTNTYKAKSRYRRSIGFRPQITKLKISKIKF